MKSGIDEFLDNHKNPDCARWFLFVERLPAVMKSLARRMSRQPLQLFATYQGKRVRVTMASYFGDVGISHDLKDVGYSLRVPIAELSDFSNQP